MFFHPSIPVTLCEVVRRPDGRCRVRYVLGQEKALQGETFEFTPKDPDDLEEVRLRTMKGLVLRGHRNVQCPVQFCEGSY